MGINRYYNSNVLPVYDWSFKMPLDLMGKTLGELQERSDRNYAAFNELPSMLNVPALKADYQLRKNIENEYTKPMQDLVAKSNGDYSQLGKDLIGFQSKLKSDLAPSGRLGAIKYNYAQFQQAREDILKDKTLTSEEKALQLNYIQNQFEQKGGTGLVDPLTGSFNTINTDWSSGFDAQKAFADVKEFKPYTEEQLQSVLENGYYKDFKFTREYVEADRVYNSLMAEVMMNPKFQEYASMRARTGKPLQIEELKKMALAETSRRAYSKNTQSMDRTYDKLPWDRMAEARAARKEAQENADRYAAMQPRVVDDILLQDDYEKIDFNKTGHYDTRTGRPLGFWENIAIGTKGSLSAGKEGAETELRRNVLGNSNYGDANRAFDFNDRRVSNNPIMRTTLHNWASRNNKDWNNLSMDKRNEWLREQTSPNNPNNTINRQSITNAYDRAQQLDKNRPGTLVQRSTDDSIVLLQALAKNGRNVKATDARGKELGSAESYFNKETGLSLMQMDIDKNGKFETTNSKGDRVVVRDAGFSTRKETLGSDKLVYEVIEEGTGKVKKSGELYYSGLSRGNDAVIQRIGMNFYNGADAGRGKPSQGYMSNSSGNFENARVIESEMSTPSGDKLALKMSENGGDMVLQGNRIGGGEELMQMYLDKTPFGDNGFRIAKVNQTPNGMTVDIDYNNQILRNVRVEGVEDAMGAFNQQNPFSAEERAKLAKRNKSNR